MSIKLQQRVRHGISLVILCLALNSCVGTVVGAVVDTTIEVVKVPFKVVGATADLLIPDKEDE